MGKTEVVGDIWSSHHFLSYPLGVCKGSRFRDLTPRGALGPSLLTLWSLTFPSTF